MDPNHYYSSFTKSVVESHQLGHFFQTRPAPITPEVEDDYLATQLVEREWFAVLPSFDTCHFRCWFAHQCDKRLRRQVPSGPITNSL